MTKKIDIIIENKLAAGERDITVFHYSSHSSHIISHNSSVTLPLRDSGENDYIHISVVKGPGYLWMDCVISLPSWADFDFSWQGKLAVIHSGAAKRILLKIPPGPPTWELNITRPAGLSPLEPVSAVHGENITISDNGTDQLESQKGGENGKGN